jgi:hypothetical protein
VSAVVGVQADPAAPISSPPKPLFDRVRAWRFIPLETYPGIVALVQRPVGKVLLFVLFAILSRPFSSLWLPVTMAAGACAYAGRYRSRVVTLATLYVLLLYPGWIDWTPASLVAVQEGIAPQLVHQLNLAMLPLFFLVSGAALYCVRRWNDRPIARRPIVCHLAVFFLLVSLGVSGLLHGIPRVALWSFITTFGAYFWFLCYALKDMRAKDGSPIQVQLGVFHPFWGGSTTTPIGKGAAYLRKVEAKNPHDLAITQLKGIKLLMWVWVLMATRHYLGVLVLDVFHVPELDDAFAAQMTGHPYSVSACWGSTIYSFIDGMLWIAIFGDSIVAVGRLAGYRMLRNSYRPLSSKTLADFWNRYYYYFKELLVDLFFFPTFLRYFKNHMSLRIFFATFMAAGVGNFTFEFLKHIRYVPEIGLFNTIIGFQTFAFYCTALSIGIGISQIRSRSRRRRIGFIHSQLLPFLSVAAFYCLLRVFATPYSQYSLAAHFSFLFRLLGVDAWI